MNTYRFFRFHTKAKLVSLSILLSSMIGGTIPTAYAESIIVPFEDQATGQEPWVTNLTPKGTHLLKDLNVGPLSSLGANRADSNVISLFGYKYFFALGNLYRSDGTAKRTTIENNIADMSITHLVKHNNKLFFTTNQSANIWRVYPRNQPDGVSAGIIIRYDQSKYQRRVVDIKAGAFDNKMLLLIVNKPRSGNQTYDMRLINGQDGWSRILNYKFDHSGSVIKGFRKVFITNRVIYFLGANNEIWMTKNTAQAPKVALLKKYKLQLSKGEYLQANTIISDKNYLYLGTNKGSIYRTDGSKKRTRQIKATIHGGGEYNYTGFHAISNNHLIFTEEENNNGRITNTLYKLNISTGRSTKLAESNRKLEVSPPLPRPIKKPTR